MKKKYCCNECKEKAILLSTSVVGGDLIYYSYKIKEVMEKGQLHYDIEKKNESCKAGFGFLLS